ncbi:MAG: HEAT repeat domain-containing protein [Thermoleophilia bacterium]|nr:HEAT repeat domain-containing protein [Thermoleophilia bacterium]
MGSFGRPNVEKMEAKQDVRGLIKALGYKDGDKDVHDRAVEALGQVRNPEAVQLLIAALKEGGDWVRVGSAHALGLIGDPQAVEPLISALKDRFYLVPPNAGVALCKIGGPQVVERLVAALKEEESRARETGKRETVSLSFHLNATVQRAREAGNPQIAAPLIAALERAHEDMRKDKVETNGKAGGGEPQVGRERPLRPMDHLWGLLRAMSAKMETLGIAYPRQERPGLDPKLDQQLPWISQTLQEAASALESGLDPFGHPITTSQVCRGLRTLVQTVQDPGYVAAMDLGHPGIGAPLHRHMDTLDSIIGDIERASVPEPPPAPSKGVQTLAAVCSEDWTIPPPTRLGQALDELREERESGSRALAALIRELLACRSPKIGHVLWVAERVTPTPALLDAVRAVSEASELTEEPAHSRFTPEIVGDGRIGWTSGTYSEVVGAALRVRASLEDCG